MEKWILKELITPKEKEILIVTLLAAGYNISDSVFNYKVGMEDNYFMSIHYYFERSVVVDRNKVDKYHIKYKELLFRLREEIKSKVNENS